MCKSLPGKWSVCTDDIQETRGGESGVGRGWGGWGWGAKRRLVRHGDAQVAAWCSL